MRRVRRNNTSMKDTTPKHLKTTKKTLLSFKDFPLSFMASDAFQIFWDFTFDSITYTTVSPITVYSFHSLMMPFRVLRVNGRRHYSVSRTMRG